jgi:hypothetical protein
MLIEIDTTQLKQLNLSPNQMIYLKVLLEKSSKALREINSTYELTEAEIDNLISRNLLEYHNGSLKITDTLNNYFKKDYFDEFYELFPSYITRTDGHKDYLRTNINKCRVAYSKIINGSYEKHKKIIDYLKYEIQQKRNTNSMCYFKRMPNWLSSEEYLIYDEILNTEQNIKPKQVYGTDIE